MLLLLYIFPCFRCSFLCRYQDKNYAYFGLQYGSECWCGRDLPDDEFLKDISECNMACVGESRLKCGGFNRMNVYQTSTFSDGDCYEDNKNGMRIFENTHTFKNPSKSNTNMPAMYK